MGKGNIRNSRFEIVRIIATLMIIGHHYVFYGVKQSYDASIVNIVYASGVRSHKLLCNMLMPGGVVGVMLFFMLAGYFGVQNSRINIKSIVMPTIFYSILGLILYCMINRDQFSLLEECNLKYLFPITNSVYWFSSVYIIIMLMKRLINDNLLGLNKWKVYILLIVLTIIYTVDRMLGAQYLGVLQGVIGYLIGAQIYINKDTFCRVSRTLCLVWNIIMWGGYVLFDYILSGIVGVFFSVSLCGTFCAAGIIIYAMIGHEKKYRIINTVAGTTYGIYLIHEFPLLRKYMWEDCFHVCKNQYSSKWFCAYAVITVLFVFCIGFTIEMIRKQFISILRGKR